MLQSSTSSPFPFPQILGRKNQYCVFPLMSCISFSLCSNRHQVTMKTNMSSPSYWETCWVVCMLEKSLGTSPDRDSALILSCCVVLVHRINPLLNVFFLIISKLFSLDLYVLRPFSQQWQMGRRRWISGAFICLLPVTPVIDWIFSCMYSIEMCKLFQRGLMNYICVAPKWHKTNTAWM